MKIPSKTKYVIAGILVLQLCIPYIASYSFLQFERNKYRKSISSQFYEKGQYIPLSADEAPKKYEFVVVRNENNIYEEQYFTNEGQKITVLYENKKWKFSSFSFAWLNLLQFIFLSSGAVLIIEVHLFHKMSRTGQDSMWGLMDYPDDNFEKLCLVYGLSIIIGNIVFLVIFPYLKDYLF